LHIKVDSVAAARLLERTFLTQLPSSAEEGKADAVAAAGVVLVKKIIFLISTTPSARAKVASQLFFAAQPPLLG